MNLIDVKHHTGTYSGAVMHRISVIVALPVVSGQNESKHTMRQIDIDLTEPITEDQLAKALVDLGEAVRALAPG